MARFYPDDRVRLTGKFLRSTGQHASREGRRVWTVQEHPGCSLCSAGRFVAVDEPDLFAESGGDMPRHIASANLQRVGEP